MNRIRKRLTYANVMSSIAVFLLIGGGAAFAATQLPKNSVGTKQLKKNAVTSAKVKNNSLLAADFKAGQLPAGAQGPKGDPGTPAPIGGTLPSGKTVVGTYAFGGSGGQPRDNITYGGYVLSTAPTAHYIMEGEAAPAGCSGGTVTNPKADPGNLCIYEGQNVGSSSNRGFLNPSNDSVSSVLAFGAGVYGTCASACRVEGTWAVTGS